MALQLDALRMEVEKMHATNASILTAQVSGSLSLSLSLHSRLSLSARARTYLLTAQVPLSRTRKHKLSPLSVMRTRTNFSILTALVSLCLSCDGYGWVSISCDGCDGSDASLQSLAMLSLCSLLWLA